MDFLFSSLAKAQIPKKILPFSQLKVSLCCLHSVNLNRQGLEYETVCVGENPYLLNVVSANITGASEGNRLQGFPESLEAWCGVSSHQETRKLQRLLGATEVQGCD